MDLDPASGGSLPGPWAICVDERDLRLAGQRARARKPFPALECEHRLRGRVVERAGHARAREVPELPEAELDPAGAVRIALLPLLRAPGSGTNAQAHHRGEPSFRRDRGELLWSFQSGQRPGDLREPRAHRRRRPRPEERPREAREPHALPGPEGAEAHARSDRRAQPSRALGAGRALRELLERVHSRRDPLRHHALHADQTAVTHEGDVHRLRLHDRHDRFRCHRRCPWRGRCLEVERQRSRDGEQKGDERQSHFAENSSSCQQERL